LVHTFQKEGRNLQHFCREAIRHMRNLLIARVCGADSDLIAATSDQRPALARAAAQFSEEDLTRFFQILLQTDDDLRRKPDPRVHLEMGLLRLINAARLAPLEELMAELKSGTPSGAIRSGMARSAAPGITSAPAPVPRSSSFTVGTQAPLPVKASTPPPMAMDAAVNEEAVVQHKRNDSAVQVSGISAEQVAEIKSGIQAQQRFLGELVDQSSRWELDGAELRIYFSPEKRPFAEMLEGRDSLEKVRVVSSKVLGRAVRVCAKLEAVAAAAASATGGTQELRAQFERDPMVRSMLQRFGGKISEVKRSQGES
jgi:DNA polymerase-3 subunit gamma/tau